MLTRLRRTVNRRWRSKPTPKRQVIHIATRQHSYTVRQLVRTVQRRGTALRIGTYDWFLAQKKLPKATYILSDFERLHPWYLERLGKHYDWLTERGCRVLNDPRKFLPRPALLRKLQAEGVNSFGCWVPSLGERPDVFPCFLRTIASHRGPASDLLHTAEEAAAALAQAMADGRVLSDLMFIEYRAEPTGDNNVFRKYSAYSVGQPIIAGLIVNDSKWSAKQGEPGSASAAEYAAELARAKKFPDVELARRVFDLSGTEFGRIDYAFVAGRPEIYEVNTNPSIKFTFDHPDDNRIKTNRLQRRQVAAAMVEVAPKHPTADQIDVSHLALGKGGSRITLSQP